MFPTCKRPVLSGSIINNVPISHKGQSISLREHARIIIQIQYLGNDLNYD